MSEELPPLKRGIPPVALLSSRTGDIACYACAKCGTVHTIANVYCAEVCCAPKVCDAEGCDSEPRQHRIYCEPCSIAAEGEKEARKFEKATKIPYSEWDGKMLYSGRLDKYFLEWWEYMEEIESDEGAEPEEYLWDCISHRVGIDAEGVIENAMDDHYEGAIEQIVDATELQDLLDAWCKKQDIETFWPSRNRAVMAPILEER